MKANGIEMVEKHGPYYLHGDAELMDELDVLLKGFIAQRRMKIDVDNYKPCWVLADESEEVQK